MTLSDLVIFAPANDAPTPGRRRRSSLEWHFTSQF